MTPSEKDFDTIVKDCNRILSRAFYYLQKGYRLHDPLRPQIVDYDDSIMIGTHILTLDQPRRIDDKIK